MYVVRLFLFCCFCLSSLHQSVETYVVLRTHTYVPPQEHTRENMHMQTKQENNFLREMLYEIL